MNHLLSTAIAATTIGLCSEVHPQSVHFMSTPVANTCAYPNVITMNPPPAVWIAPNDSRVMTKFVTSFVTPIGNYVPVGVHGINPGNLCMLEACTPGSITLTCAPVGADGHTTVIKLKREGSDEPSTDENSSTK